MSASLDLSERVGRGLDARIAGLVAPFSILTLASSIFVLIEGSLVPAFPIMAFGMAGALIVKLLTRRPFESLAFFWSFAVYQLFAAVTQSVNPLYGDMFFSPDSQGFFAAARGDYGDVALTARIAINGKGVIDSTLGSFVAQKFYNAARIFQGSPGAWTVLLPNILYNSVTVVLTAMMARKVFRDARSPVVAATVFVASCPLFLVYAIEPLRDGLATMLVSFMAYAVLNSIVSPGMSRLFLCMAVMLVASYFLFFVRQQFIFIGPMLLIFHLCCSFFGAPVTKSRTIMLISTALLVSTAIILALPIIIPLIELAQQAREIYMKLAGSSGGLGAAVLESLPLGLRPIWGLLYFHLFPIPLWAFLTPEVMPGRWLSSIQGFWLTALFPAAVAGGTLLLLRRSREKVNRPGLAMLALAYLAMEVIVALTSLEHRHLAIFYPAFVILAAVPFAIGPSAMALLRSSALGWFAIVGLVHIVWAVAKFGL